MLSSCRPLQWIMSLTASFKYSYCWSHSAINVFLLLLLLLLLPIYFSLFKLPHGHSSSTPHSTSNKADRTVSPSFWACSLESFLPDFKMERAVQILQAVKPNMFLCLNAQHAWHLLSLGRLSSKPLLFRWELKHWEIKAFLQDYAI